MGNSLLIGVPVYGQIALTHDLISDLRREQLDFVIVDNAGDYEPLDDEWVITPGRNIGWAGGSNVAIRSAFAGGYEWAMTLNNDVRLSRGFGDGLFAPGLPDDAGVIGPGYDDLAHPEVLSEYSGPAADYEPRAQYRVTPIVDGTAMMIKRDAWSAIGDFDERTFGDYAWGANLDLCLRSLDAGYGVYCTEMSFINHLGRRTVRDMDSRYEVRAMRAMKRGMKQVYGNKWRMRAFAKEIEVRQLSSHRTVDLLVREQRSNEMRARKVASA